ncbi:DUF4209 domain-containing protein [Heliorestis acidaminivorans]|uniref:DUF4209 domain-containing protein n=1 Tax=Heliorestis acidaminivorans TaxID=553427 RepID=A0A6I0EVW6_9FIRM|nr:DUF4209 domain-containing protein [Heliorestis acidaminivorans]KAB2953749.1 DUF4209 domain-containing protein [Heliorestis acidaminivorans]
MEDDTRLLESINHIENMDYFEHLGTASTYFSGVKELALQLNKIEIAKYMQFEIEAMRLYPQKPYGQEPYTRRFEIQAFNIDLFTKEQLDYYKTRLDNSNNLFLKSRYADILFDYRGEIYKKDKFIIGQKLVILLIELAEKYLLRSNYLSCYDCVARSIEVSIRLGLKKQITTIINNLKKIVDNTFESDKRWVLEPSRFFYQIASSKKTNSLLTEKDIAELNMKLSETIGFYWENKDYHYVRLFCNEILRWHKYMKSSEEEVNYYLNKIGLSFEEESKYQQNRIDKSSIVEAHFLEKALEHYANIGNKDKVLEMKVNIRQAYNEAVEKGEFETHIIKTEIPECLFTALEERISKYKEYPKEIIIETLKMDVSMIPSLCEIIKMTKNQNNLLHRKLIQPTIVNEGKKILQTTDDKDEFLFYVNQNYSINMTIILEFYLMPIFNILKNDKDLQASDILSVLRNWGMIEDSNYDIVEIGINRYFKGDYVSSLHILLPQLEACIRKVFTKAGYATTTIKKGNAQHEETLNSFLERPDIKEAIDVDFHKFIQFILVDQSGYNLRNIFAHGLVDINMCNEKLATLVLFIYMKITDPMFDI